MIRCNWNLYICKLIFLSTITDKQNGAELVLIPGTSAILFMQRALGRANLHPEIQVGPGKQGLNSVQES